MRRTLRLLPILFSVFLAAGCAPEEGEPAPFTVVGSDPADGQTDVPLNATIAIRFSVPPDLTTIQGTKQIILVDQVNSIIPVTFAFQGEILDLTPLTPLGPSATYGIAVRPGVRDIHGDGIRVPFEARFSTGPSVASIPNWAGPPIWPLPPGPGPLGGSGTISPTGDMIHARARHRMTALLDGRMLCTGGLNDGPEGLVLSSAELFDPDTLEWRLCGKTPNGTPGMNHARFGHSSTLLKDGRVLIAGGSDGSRILDEAEIYDPKADLFIPVASRMANRRVFHSAHRLQNGNVLLIAGLEETPVPNAASLAGSAAESRLLDSLEVFDAPSGTFVPCEARLLSISTGSALRLGVPLPLSGGRILHASAVLPGGSVLVCGGCVDAGDSGLAATEDAQLYVPDEDGSGAGGIVRHAGANLSTPRAGHTATALGWPSNDGLDGLALVAGGFPGTPAPRALATCEIFDLQVIAETRPWAGSGSCFAPMAAEMPVPRQNHTATPIKAGRNAGGVLLVGGAGFAPERETAAGIDPRIFPRMDPGNVSTAALTPRADVFLPRTPWPNADEPFRGIQSTSSIAPVKDKQGRETDLSAFYPSGAWFHEAEAFPNGAILVGGGAGFLSGGTSSWTTVAHGDSGGIRFGGPSVLYNP
jgi:hypothetical protein